VAGVFDAVVDGALESISILSSLTGAGVTSAEGVGAESSSSIFSRFSCSLSSESSSASLGLFFSLVAVEVIVSSSVTDV